MNACLAAGLACLSGGEARADDIVNQTQFDEAIAAAAASPAPTVLDVSGGSGLLVLQSGTASYPPGASPALQVNFSRTILDVGGASAPGAALTLGPNAALGFTGAVTAPSPGRLAGFLRVGYGGAGTLNLQGGAINLAAITGGSDPGRLIVGGGGGSGTSTVSMTGGTISFSHTGSNYSGFAIGRTVGPEGVFTQSGGTVSVTGTLANDIGTQGGTGTYALSGEAVFLKGPADNRGILYVGSRPDTGTGVAGAGTVHVSDRASYTFYSDNIYVGDARATGTFIQDGAGSQVVLQGDNGVLFGTNIGSNGGANGGGTGSYLLSAGTLTIAGNSQSATFGSGAGGRGTLEVSGGTLTVLGSAGLRLGDVAGATGTAIQSGGEVTARVSFGAGTGSYALSGGTLKTSNGITGGADDSFTLSGGTLDVLAGATTSSGFLTTLSAASTIQVDGTSAAWNSVVSGAGALTKTGAGVLSLGAANSAFTGDVTVSQGTFAVTHAAALSSANDVYVASGAAFDTSGLGSAALSVGALTGSGALILGNSALAVSVATGETAAYSGVITAGYTSGSVYGRFTKAGAGTLVIDGASMADTASGTGEFYVTQGTLAQTGGTTAIAYLDVGTGTVSGTPNVGAIAISGGTLTVKRTFSVGGWGGIGSATQTGGTVVTPDPGSCTSCGGFYIGNQGGTGVYNLSGGTIDFTGGVLDLGRTNNRNASAFSGTLNVSDDGELIIRKGNLILGNWLVNASGGGATTTGIGDGILNQSGGTIRVENAGALYLGARGDGTYNLTGGVLEIGGTSLQSVYANAGGSYALNLRGGTIRVLDTALTTSAAATLGAGTTSTIDTNGLGATWNGALTGSGILTKAGAGTLALGNLSASGILNLSQGDIASTGANNSLGLLVAGSGGTHTLQVASGRTLTLTGDAAAQAAALVYKDTTLNISGGGTVKVSGQSFVVGFPDGDTPTGGAVALSGSTRLDLNASPTFTNLYVGVGSRVEGVTGSFTQTDTSRVTLGTNMIIGGDGAVATYTLNDTSVLATGGNSFVFIGLNEGQRTSGTRGTLILNDSASFDFTDEYLFVGIATAGPNGGSGTFAGDGAIVQNDASVVHLGGSNVAIGLDAGGTGTFRLNGGTLTIDTAGNGGFLVGARTGAVGLLDQSGGTLSATTSVTVGAAGAGTYAVSGGTATFGGGLLIAASDGGTGTVNQTGGLVSVTAGDLRFGRGTGAYNLAGGTLSLAGAILGDTTGADSLNFSGGVLSAGGALTASGTFGTTIAAAATAVFDTNGYGITWGSAISGSGDLRKTGAGTLTLSAANSFTGAVEVEVGTLALSNAAALGSANDVWIDSGATFNVGAIPAGAPFGSYNLASIGKLSGSGTVNLGRNGLVVNIAEGDTSAFSGSLVADQSSWQSANLNNSFIKNGPGTLVVDGMSMTRGNLYVVGGTLAQTSGTTSLTYLAVGEGAGSNGIFSVTGGRADIGEALQVGDWGGTGTVNQSGGVVSLLATCASSSNCVAMNIGNQGGTGTYNLTGGQLLISGGSHSIGRNAGAQPTSSGTLNISGTALMQMSPNGAFGTGFLVIGDRDAGSAPNSTGVLNQSGGTVRFMETSRLYLGGYGAGTYNLTGGTLEIGGASLLGLYGGGGNTTGSYAFNLGGGTIKVIGSALTTSVNAALVSGTTSTIDTNGLGATWGGTLSGAGALAKVGAGTLTLSIANTHSGGTTLSGGRLALGNAGALGSGALSFTDDAVLGFGGSYTLGNAVSLVTGKVGTIDTGSSSVTLAGTVTGGGTLAKVGAGTLTLSGVNTYSGGTSLSAGIFALANGSAAGTGLLSVLGTSTLSFLNALTLANPLALVGSGTTGLFDTGANAVTLSGPITGSGALSKTGSGVLTLAGTSSFDGPTTVSSGTLAVTGTLTGSAVSVGSGATLTGSGSIGQGVTVQSGGRLAGATGAQLFMGALTLGSGSVINANLTTPSTTALFSVGGALTLDGTLNVTSPSLDIGVYRLFSYGGTLTDNGLQIGTLPGGLQASDLLIAANNGRVDLVNTAGAVLRFWNGGATLGPGTGTVDGGTGTWSVTNANWTTASALFNAPMAPQPGFAVFEGAAGTVSIDNGPGAVGATGLQFLTSGYLIEGGALALSGAPTVIRVGDGTGAGAAISATIASALTGANGLEKTDLGTLVLTGANTYTGTTLITAGTLALSGSGSIAASSGVVANARLDIAGTGAGATVASLQGSGTVALGTRTLTLSAPTGTFSGAMSGTGGLTLSGGTLTLAGANGFSGTTTIEDGAILALAGGGGIAASRQAVVDGILDLSGGTASSSLVSLSGGGTVLLGGNGLVLTQAAGTFSGAIAGTGGLTLHGGAQTLSGASTYSGGTTLSGGMLTLGNAGALGTGLVQFAANATLGFGGGLSLSNALAFASSVIGTVDIGSGAASLTGALSGTGTLAKTGTGALTLSGANDGFTGAVSLEAGTLNLSGSAALGGQNGVTLAAGASLDIAGVTGASGLSLGALSGAGTVVTGQTRLSLGGGAFSGSITGQGGLTKTGDGTLTLGGANSYEGTTLVSAGTLKAGAAHAFSAASATTIAAGATLDLGGLPQTIDAVSLAGGTLANGALAGSVTSQGGTISGLSGTASLTVASGMTTLSGSNSFTGATQVTGGTLAVSGILAGSDVGVGAGGILTGGGSISGAVSVGAGGALSGATGSTLSMGSLTLDAGALINAGLSSTSSTPLFAVDGNLVLDGTLNITGPSVGIGVSRLFTYGGTLTDHGLAFGTLPGTVAAADLSIIANGGRVDLINTAGAVLQFWNGSATAGPGTGTIAGGTGTWSLSGGNWTDATGTFNSPMQPQPGFAIFGGTAGTVSVDTGPGAVAVTGMQFITSGYVIAGDAITLAATPSTIRVGDGSLDAASTTATIAAALTGAAGIEKTDLGTLVLTGVNTYTGETVISGGRLALAGAGSIAASSGVVANGRLDISGTDAGATIASLQGGGTVALGARTLTLAHAVGTFSGAISGTGGLAVQSGTQTLTGASGFTGGVRLSGGSVAVGGASALGSGTLAFGANGTLAFLDSFTLANALAIEPGATARVDSGSGQAGLSGAISGAGALVKAGSGALTLSGASTYSGGTTLEAGSLVLGHTHALGTGALTFAHSGAVTFGVGGTFATSVAMSSGTTATFDTAGQAVTLSGALSGAGTLAKTGAGTLNLSGSNTYGGGTRLSGGTLGLLAAGALGSGGLDVTADATLLFGTGQTFATATTLATGATATFESAGAGVMLSGPISGSGALRTAGSGTFTFTDANTYGGGTILAGGIVRLDDAAALGTGAVSVAASTRIVTGFAAPFAYAFTLGGGTLATFDTSLFDVRLTGGVSGAGGLGVTGGGTVSLGAPASYSGATSISSGTLRAAVPGAFSSASAVTVAAGAALDLGGTAQAVGSLAGAGAVQLGAATLTTGADNADTTFSGAISGTGGLTKVGTGNFTVASTNSYAGDTTIAAGTVTVAAHGALGTGLINLLGSGALAFAGAYDLFNRLDVSSGGAIDTSGFPVTLTGDISGSGSVTKTGTGTLVLSGNNSFTGGLFVEGGTLSATTPQALGSGALDFQGASTFVLPDAALGPVTNPVVLGASVTLTPPAGGVADLAGAISGAGGVAVSGPGTVVLGGQNTYAGATEVGAGSLLRTSAPGALPAATALTVAAGAQVDLGGNSQSIGSLGGGGAVTLGSGTLTSGNNNADSVFTGTLSGTGGFNKVGTGKMVFDGTGTTGPATVSGGAFIVGGEAGSSATFSGPVTVGQGGTVGGHGTVGTVTVEDGGAFAPGNSIGTLTTSGNLVLSPASTFLLEVNATQSDVVHVIGNAQLAGILQVNTSAGWTANLAYVFLTATGSVTGTFSDVVDDLPLVDAEIAYGANSVSLMLVPSDVAFSTLAATPNEATTAAAAQSLGAGNAIYNAILLLNAPAAQAAFSALSGGIYPGTATLFLMDSRFIRDATLARVRTPLGAPGAAEGPRGSWAQAVGSWGTIEGNANAPSLSRTIAGMFAGMDGQVGERVRLGFAAGYTQTSFDVGGLYSSGSSDDYHVALYGSAGLGPVELRGGTAFSWHDMTVNRTVAFAGFTDQDIADVSAHTAQVYGELALPWTFAAGMVEPFLSAAYVHGATNPFTERGGASALAAAGLSADVGFTTLGLRATAALPLAVPVTLRGMVGWQHAFGDLAPVSQFTFASGSLPFAVSGVGVPEDALVLEAGLDFALAPGAALGVSYSGLWGSAVSDNALKGTLQIQF